MCVQNIFRTCSCKIDRVFSSLLKKVLLISFNFYLFQIIMGSIWSFFNPKENIASRQRQQQLVIKEIESIEACVYCYIDGRLKTLLMPYATRLYPWDLQCEILPHFREKSDSQSRKCYHCLKGQLKDHFSCQIIDKIFQKKTQKC